MAKSVDAELDLDDSDDSISYDSKNFSIILLILIDIFYAENFLFVQKFFLLKRFFTCSRNFFLVQ